jgi:signal transduction histidine kinase/HAMP domain-containing protein
MKFSAKLILLFVTLTVVPMLFLIILVTTSVRDASLSETVSHLTSIADIQKERTLESLDRYLEQAKLIASRSQLRISLDKYNQDSNTDDLGRIDNILKDAQDSIDLVNEINIYSNQGVLIRSTANDNSQETFNSKYILRASEEFFMSEVFQNKNGVLSTSILGPLVLDEKVIGILEVISDAKLLTVVAQNYSGLGDTGETLIAKKDDSGDALFLTPVRFDTNAALNRVVLKTQINVPMTTAIAGQEKVLIDQDIVDYQGIPVVSVTRYIGDLDWGLVVKISRDEVLNTSKDLSVSLWSMALIIILIVSIVAFRVSEMVSNPIAELTKIARKFQLKDFTARAHVSSQDEIGLMSEAFNDMANIIQKSYKNLENEVKNRTKELEETTNRMVLATKSAQIGIWEWDVVNNVLTWDDQMYKLYGLKKGDFSGAYEAWQNGLHPDDKKNGEDAVQKALKGEKDFSVTFRVIWPDGQVKYLQAHALVERDKGGKALKMIGVNWDITNEKTIDKAKTEFVSLASHQLRTPLSSIGWFTEMLMDSGLGKVNKKQKEYLEEIYSGKQRMAELITALLNVSRLELGTFGVDVEDIEPQKVLNSVLGDIEQKVKDKKIKLNKEIQINLPIMKSDHKLLSIIFQNFLTNAVKYTKEGGSIDITLKSLKKGEVVDDKKIKVDSLYFSVKDTGIGIPERQKDKIFSKLFRADNVGIVDTDGTGLGLYIIKSVLDVLKGQVWFQSKENEGSEFSCLIPVKHIDFQNKTGKKLE